MSDGWIKVGPARSIPPDDVVRFDHGQQTYAIYRTTRDEYYATAGLCTHGAVHLAGGFVMDTIIECPKHNGRFDFRTGAAQGPPACINLKTYPVKVEGGELFLKID